MNRMIRISVLHDSVKEQYSNARQIGMEAITGVVAGMFGYAVGNLSRGSKAKKHTYLMFTYLPDIESDRRSSVILINNNDKLSNMARFVEEFEKRKVL